ncbi:translocation protein TolB, partial [Corallococcus carmarthensis]|nr:translocation protein TolB [Corallococcus carmarthensis]
MSLNRRELLRLSMLGGGALALGPGLLNESHAAPAQPGPSPYGAISGWPDANGVRLPAGFTSRIIARSGQAVGNTGYTWHGAPNGGNCFSLATGDWVYVSNGELGAEGGASAVRFDGSGAVVGAYRILANT